MNYKPIKLGYSMEWGLRSELQSGLGSKLNQKLTIAFMAAFWRRFERLNPTLSNEIYLRLGLNE